MVTQLFTPKGVYLEARGRAAHPGKRSPRQPPARRGPSQATTSSEPARRLDRALTSPGDLDPDLAHVIDRWQDLPEAIRRAILALVGTVGKSGE